MKLKDLKQGAFFTRKPIAAPKESQVWIRGGYDRSSGSYECTRFDDINDFRQIKGETEVYTEFVF